MKWTLEDELALERCRKRVEQCRNHHITPAPEFITLLRACAMLEKAGLIRRATEDLGGLCAGCAENRNGNCLRAYQGAKLSQDGTVVEKCRMRRERRESA